MLADRSIMVALYKSGFIIISIYVDDLLIAAMLIELIKEVNVRIMQSRSCRYSDKEINSRKSSIWWQPEHIYVSAELR